MNLFLWPWGAMEWVGGGNHAEVNPLFAISWTLHSRFPDQSHLWDSQLNACNYNRNYGCKISPISLAWPGDLIQNIDSPEVLPPQILADLH